MHSLPSGQIFSRADARDWGWSDTALTRALNAGRVRRIRRGWFVVDGANSPDPISDACAAACACDGSVVSHRSAALLYGLPLLDPPPARPDLTVLPRATGDVAHGLLHRARLDADEIRLLDGTRVTSPARTVVDVARTVPTPAAVVTADAALQRGLTNQADLASMLRRCERWPGIKRAATAASMADARAESPLETLSRLLIVELGLPRPELQAVITDRRRRFVARVDFYWDEFGVFGEADGLLKYTRPSDLVDEKLRQERLENLWLIPVRWGWTDVVGTPRRRAALASRIRQALSRGRARQEMALPRMWSASVA